MRWNFQSMLNLKSLVIVAACLFGSSQASAANRVALTFDDLPALSILPSQSYVDYVNERILYKLRRHHVPAIGFVNEGKIDELVRDHQIRNLKRWVDAGMDLGNHSYSHSALNDVGAQAYVADIARGEPVTRALLEARGKRLRYFRAPYLQTGQTRNVKDEVERWLTAHGYTMAPVTIDADDWEFAEPYDDAIARKDEAQQQHIRAEYLSYTAQRVAWALASARRLFGRDIRHIMLLHCTRLNADTLDDIIQILRKAHLKPVTLSDALQDPVYRQPDTYVGADGIDWLERWADARRVDLPEQGNTDPPADIQAAYDRVDDDRQK